MEFEGGHKRGRPESAFNSNGGAKKHKQGSSITHLSYFLNWLSPASSFISNFMALYLIALIAIWKFRVKD